MEKTALAVQNSKGEKRKEKPGMCFEKGMKEFKHCIKTLEKESPLVQKKKKKVTKKVAKVIENKIIPKPAKQKGKGSKPINVVVKENKKEKIAQA